MSIELTDFRSALSPDGTSWSFTGVDFGAPADDRYLVIVIGASVTGTFGPLGEITSVDAGGTAGVAAATMGISTGVTAIWRTAAPVTAGLTGTVSIVFSAAMSACWIAVYRATSLASPIPADTFATSGAGVNAALTLDVVKGVTIAGATLQNTNGSFAFGGAASRAFEAAAPGHAVGAAATAGGIAWSGLDEDGEASIGESGTFAARYTVAAASFEIATASLAAAQGTAVASAAGRSEARGQGTVAAIATAAANARGEARGSAAMQGAALAAATGRSEARGSGAASGGATAAAISNVPAGDAAGSASALATGRAAARGRGAAAALAAAQGRAAMRAAAQGLADAPGAGRSEARAAGLAEGSGAAAGFPLPAGQAVGGATALATGRAEARAPGMAQAGAGASAQGRGARYFTIMADENGAFSFDYAGLLPPGSYAARARAQGGGGMTGWSSPVSIEAVA